MPKWDDLKILDYPDPRLKALAKPVQSFDDDLRALTVKMFELMRQEQGVGLAAPQVGQSLRLFVMNATGKPEDDRVFINPELFEADGSEEADEGCLSLPDIRSNITRSKSIRIAARDVTGKPVEEAATGFVARIWQHEHDHLNGILILNRMGPVALVMHKKKLRELEEKFAAEKSQSPKPRPLPPKPPATADEPRS